MKLAVQIVNWVMLVIGALAFIELVMQASNGTKGNGPGIIICIIWIVQSTLTIVFINQFSFEEEK